MPIGAALPFIYAGVTAASVGIAAYSQYQQGKIADATVRQNAAMMEAEAEQADMEAREELRRLRRMNQEQLAARRAEIGASGVVGFTGSPLAVLGEEAGRLELRAQDMARAATLQRQRGFAEASMTRWSGRQARSASRVAMAGTILGGAARMAGGYANLT